MKYINVILVMLVGVFHTNAQEYRVLPNPDDKPLWVSQVFDGEHDVCDYIYTGMIGDTVINSKQYKKIYHLNDTIVETEYISSLFGGVREELGKVYIIYNMVNDGINIFTDEFLLFDYSLSIGDDAILAVEENVSIANIDSLTLNDGLNYRRYSFEGDEEWIEGIGSTVWDVFRIDHHMEGVDDCGNDPVLSCFKLDNMLVYGDDCGSEDYNTTNIVEPKQISPIEFYPNPMNDYLYYKFNHSAEGEKCKIKIIDLSGKLVHEDVLSSGNNAISLNHVNGGMYIVKIIFKDSMFNETLVIDNY